MEVLKSGDAPLLISNVEVSTLLKERAAKRSSKTKANIYDEITNTPFQNRNWIEDSVLSYLSSSPCSNVEKLEDMSTFVQKLQSDPSMNGYGLTNTETLQVLNHLPSSLVELHLLIEDIESRQGFVGDEHISGEEKQEEFLSLIARYSGSREAVGDLQGNEEMGE